MRLAQYHACGSCCIFLKTFKRKHKSEFFEKISENHWIFREKIFIIKKLNLIKKIDSHKTVQKHLLNTSQHDWTERKPYCTFLARSSMRIFENETFPSFDCTTSDLYVKNGSEICIPKTKLKKIFFLVNNTHRAFRIDMSHQNPLCIIPKVCTRCAWATFEQSFSTLRPFNF